MKTKLCTTFLCSLRVSSRNLCRELYVCGCVCVSSYPCSSHYSPPFWQLCHSIALAVFASCMRICCTFYNSNRNCHPFAQFVVLVAIRLPYTPCPGSSHARLPSHSQSILFQLHLMLFGNLLAWLHTHHMAHFLVVFPISNLKLLLLLLLSPLVLPPIYPLRKDNIQLNVWSSSSS